MAKDEEKAPAEVEESEEENESEAGHGADEEDADDADESEDSGDDEEDEEEAAEAAPAGAESDPPPKPAREAPKVAAATAKSRADEPPRIRPRPVRAPEPPPPPVAGTGKRVFLFVLVLGVLTAGFFALGGSDTTQPGAARWKPGQTVNVDITLVKEDGANLACGSPSDVSGRKCEYQNKTQKNDGLDDAHMLKPYTTTDQIQFLAAGLWSQPQLDKSKLPAERFTVRCRYHVEGSVKSPLIRWNPSAPWGEKNPDWNAGYLDNCKLNP